MIPLRSCSIRASIRVMSFRAFATLRFAGDALDPDEISRVVKQQPTKAYRKGETYRSGPHGPDVTGRTGVWFFSTRRKVPSKDLIDHLRALDTLIAPFGDQDNRLKELRKIMARRNLQAHVTFFGAALLVFHILRFHRYRLLYCNDFRLTSSRISLTKIAKDSSSRSLASICSPAPCQHSRPRVPDAAA